MQVGGRHGALAATPVSNDNARRAMSQLWWEPGVSLRPPCIAGQVRPIQFQQRFGTAKRAEKRLQQSWLQPLSQMRLTQQPPMAANVPDIGLAWRGPMSGR